MNPKNETSRKRIGFKNYDDEVISDIPETAGNMSNEKNVQGVSIPMSVAQVSLCEKINDLISLIASKEFASFPDKQRHAFVVQLLDFAELNAELTTKTTMLLM